MQDRYFGDVGDFGKYGLLRALSGTYPGAAPLRLGIVWYLAEDETHNNDGKHTGYLGHHGYRACDPQLFDGLKRVAMLPRRVALVPDLRVFPSSTTYVDDRLELTAAHHSERDRIRAAWLSRALGGTRDSELVFCDPDNGIATDPKTLRSPKGAKFAGLGEIAAFYSRGQSVVVYHHADRTAPVTAQALVRARQLKRSTMAQEVICLRYRRGTTRLFFVIPTEEHSQVLETRAVALLASPWGQHFDRLPVD